MKNYVSNELESIEELRNSYEKTAKDNNETIEELKEKNKLLQSELEHNNNEIKFLEQEKTLNLESISIKEKQLHKKIEKFIGAKIF